MRWLVRAVVVAVVVFLLIVVAGLQRQPERHLSPRKPAPSTSCRQTVAPTYTVQCR